MGKTLKILGRARMQPGALIRWTKPTFLAKSRAVVNRIQTEIPPWYRSRMPWRTVDEQIEYAYEIYGLVHQNRLNSLVLGHGRLFEDAVLTANFGTTNKRLLKAASYTPKDLQGTGSVLADAYWVPYLNDSWVLGGIHSRSAFYTGESSPKFPTVKLWDLQEKRPTVFGRELVLLDVNGYRMADLKWAHLCGVAFEPGSWSANPDFKDFYELLDQVGGPDDLEEILKSLGKR